MRISEGFARRWSGALSRVLVYGAAVLIVGGGLRWHSQLTRRAARADVAYQGPVVYAGTLGKERLYDALLRAGTPPQEASAISRALAKAISTRRLLPDDRYRIVRSTAGEFRHLTLSSGLKRCVVTRRSGGFHAFSREVVLATHRNRRAGTIKGNLWLSMEAEGVPAGVIAGCADMFRWTVDFLTEPREGDRFAVLWTERRTPEGRVRDRTILSGLYRGRETGTRTAILFGGEYYDAGGESSRRMFLRAPLQFRTISSYFARRRYHPILRYYRPHHGTDYVAPRGTPVASVADGIVVFAGRDRGFGNVVKLRHGAVYATRYAHLSRIAGRIRKGLAVRQGQTIGFVGSTGMATGPHLHFEIEKQGRPENFLKLRLPFARSVAANRLAEFRSLRDRRQAEMDGLLAAGGS